MRNRFMAVTFVLVFAPTGAVALPIKYAVVDKVSRATFKTEAPLETIVGTTADLSGTVEFDAAKPKEGKGRIEVGLASLKTGIDMRDEHLRSAQWLDTPKHPKATFETIKITLEGPLQPNQKVKGTVSGKLTIHGIARDIVAEASGTLIPRTDELKKMNYGYPGDLVKIDAQFRTSFTGHGMQVPKMLFYKVSNDIDIDVSLILAGTTVAP